MAQEAPKKSQNSSDMLKHASQSTENDNNSNQRTKTTTTLTLSKIPQNTAIEDSKENNEKKNDNIESKSNANKSNENVIEDVLKPTYKEKTSNENEKRTDTLKKISQCTKDKNVVINDNIDTNNNEKNVNSDQVLNSIIVKHSEFKSKKVIDLNPLLKALSSSNQAHNVLRTEFRKKHVIYDKQTDSVDFKAKKFTHNYKLKMSLESNNNKQGIKSS